MDGWNKGIKWLQKELTDLKPTITKLYEKFLDNPKKLDADYWRGFYKMYKENLERKQNEV